ncbi:MAG: hypothetical protein KKG75_05535 [Nanoarchaeota archaeon]|nr:hypothetical protein [Nanoarchaeota archaeon]
MSEKEYPLIVRQLEPEEVDELLARSQESKIRNPRFQLYRIDPRTGENISY